MLRGAIKVRNPKSGYLDIAMIEVKCTHDNTDIKAEINCRWQKELPMQDKRVSKQKSNEGPTLDYSLKAAFNDRFLALFTVNVGKKEYILYLYDHSAQYQYLGFVDVLKFLEFEPYDAAVLLKSGFAIDMELPQALVNMVLFTCLNRVFVLGWDGGAWRKVRVINDLSSVDARNINDVRLHASPNGGLSVTVNRKWLLSVSKYLQLQGTNIHNPQMRELPVETADSDEEGEQPVVTKTKVPESKEQEEPQQA